LGPKTLWGEKQNPLKQKIKPPPFEKDERPPKKKGAPQYKPPRKRD